ncbi:hypothetical protein [Kitasatospora sp. NPDC051914]|uniref:hypothetical protein n=1 Tax=Kitasatospora sp. NPDC051914 TaxID=3154945 RepID=UPI00343FD828
MRPRARRRYGRVASYPGTGAAVVRGAGRTARVGQASPAKTAAAYEHYRRAAKSTASLAEQRHPESRAGRVGP